MERVEVKLCIDCLYGLLQENPYVDRHGNKVSLKGIRLSRVSHENCDNSERGKHSAHPITLTKIFCRHCYATSFTRVKKGDKPICPVCHSLYVDIQ